MPTLVLRGVPDDLYQQLKRTAGIHRRSMTQEAISLLESGLRVPAAPIKPSPDEVKDWLRREVWTLSVLDKRSADDILGYNEHGLFD
jgi:antitoxin VapB